MNDRLAEIRARLDAATPGPWELRGGIIRSANVPVCIAASHAPSAYLIAHAPADIAWLLDEVERLRAPMLTLNTTTGEITRG